MNEDLDLNTPGVVVDTMKAAKDDPAVNYKYALDPEKSCGMCVHFRAPGTCELVMGVVRAVDSCNLFEARPDGGRVRAEIPSGSGWNGQAGLDQTPESPDDAILGGTQEEPDGEPERDLPIDHAQVRGPGPVQSILVPAKPMVPKAQAEWVGQGKFGDPSGTPRVQAELAEAWDEGKHPRGEGGRWVSEPGGVSAAAPAARQRVYSLSGDKADYTIGGGRFDDKYHVVRSTFMHDRNLAVQHIGAFDTLDDAKSAAEKAMKAEKQAYPMGPGTGSRAANKATVRAESAKSDRRLLTLVESVVESMYCECKEDGTECACSFTPKGKRTFKESRAIEAVQAEVNDAARTASVILITEGLGNLRDKNYYTSDACATAAKVFEGKQFYIDHPSSIDEESRPERSVRDLAGWFSNCKLGSVKDPDTGEQLAATFATLNFAESEPGNLALGQVKAALRYQKMYPGKKDVYCGISINAGGLSEPGEIDGIEVNVVHEIEDAFSADIVTKPARGGKFLALSESEKRNLEKVESSVSTFLGSLLRERLAVAA